jgi:hypothetical protein
MEHDYDRIAAAIRAFIGVKRIPQIEICKGTEIPPEMLSRFLCRRINLIDSDIEKIVSFLDMKDYLVKLSAPANLEGTGHGKTI